MKKGKKQYAQRPYCSWICVLEDRRNAVRLHDENASVIQLWLLDLTACTRCLRLDFGFTQEYFQGTFKHEKYLLIAVEVCQWSVGLSKEENHPVQ